jgi:hypothetical protein
LFGGEGDDTLDAQSGNDRIDGGAGNDILRGGDGHDTYLMNLSSGADTIYNYDPNGTDYDVIGYDGITREQLWFERSGDDMIITVIGTDVRTTIVNWYLLATENERANYKIDFIIAGEHVTETINAEALVDLMAPYTPPATQEQFETIRETPEFSSEWSEAWRTNAPPIVPSMADQTINEDGSVTLNILITDDVTPAAGVTVTVQAVRPDNHDVEDLSIVNPPTLSAPDASGNRTLTVNTLPNTSGQVAIRVTATDAGGISTTRDFLITVNAVADVPVVTVAQAVTPTAPLTQPTLDSGSWAINLQAALVDQDGSETLEVRIANVPTGITFSAGSDLGGGVWSFTPAQLPNLRVQGPTSWSQDLALSVTAIARESNGSTATSAPTPLNIVINARPTDISPPTGTALTFDENTAPGTALVTFQRTDADVGDTARFELLNNANGRFTMSPSGVLSTGNVILDHETGPTQSITVRVTDSGGLSYDEQFTITVRDVNEAPSLQNAAFNVLETAPVGTHVGTVAATDPDNYGPYRDFRYRLLGTNANLFAIDERSGAIRLRSQLDADTGTGSYSVNVEVWDGGGIGQGNSRTATVNVTAMPQNEAPQITYAPNFWIPEDSDSVNPPAGRWLRDVSGEYAQVFATDPERGPVTWSVHPNEAGDYDTQFIQINEYGILTAHPRLDYENYGYHDFYVRATDAQGLYTEQLVTVYLTDVPEDPVITGVYGWVEPSNWNTWQYAGTISTVDPDGGPMTYEILSAYVRIEGQSNPDGSGWVNIDEWQAANPSGSVSIDSSGRMQIYWYMYDGWIQPPFWEHYFTTEWHLNLIARDSTGRASLPVGITIKDDGSPNNITFRGVWHPPGFPPVAFDLDGDGIELVSFADSNVSFRLKQDGESSRTGWIGADDALLVLDRDGDGAITHGAEISFVDDLPGAKSDLEGLAAFDTDGDGSFDRDDARFAEFRVWRDANQDGVSQSDELHTLAEHGIASIGLNRTLTGQQAQVTRDNIITATSEFIRSDGTKGLVGDVELAYEGSGYELPVPPPPPGSPPIDEIDRSARDEVNPALLSQASQSNDVDLPDVDEPAPSEFSRAARSASEGEKNSARRRPWRWSDLQGSDVGDEQNVEDTAAAGLRQGALHASLDSVVRRRLQMVEAMASFAPEGASMLELQPRRKVDARTLELLTSVPEVRVM